MSSKSLEKQNIKIFGGAQETPFDSRDAKFGKLFGLTVVEELPEEFQVPMMSIKDQGNSDFCTGYAVTAASEIQEGVELCPEFQYAMTKQLSGESIEAWGANIRDALKSAINYGSLAQALVPENLRYNGRNRDLVANPLSWNEGLSAEADKHRKKAFAQADGPYDMYDNIRTTLWEANKEYLESGDVSKRRVIVTGSMWRNQWTRAEGGEIPEEFIAGGFGHAFVIKGWRKDGKLVAHLSNGTNIGKDGDFFFSPVTVNREFHFGGAFTLIDEDKETIKQLTQMNLSIKWKWLARIIVAIRNLFRRK